MNSYAEVPESVRAIQANPPVPMVAFHGSQELKDFYVGRAQYHYEQDEIIHGEYWNNGKGCAVGCTIHSGTHAAYETELGLPAWLARLEDGMFEAQSNGDSQTFPIRFLSVIPVGADTEAIKFPFLAWLMDDPSYGVFQSEDAEIRALALEVAAKLRAGETAGSAADDLTKRLEDAWAARAARDAWAAWAAWDARDAWAAWDARDAWDAYVKTSVAELLRLLGALHV